MSDDNQAGPQGEPQGEPWLRGGDHRKVDAMERMRGITRYTDDLKLPGMLHAKIKRSPHPHAKILSIDASRALAMPGVHAVVTGKDFPIPYGIIPWTPDENALCVDKALYVGDGVAAVAAIDEDTAIEALDAIDVQYEVLPPLYDPEEALAARDNQINPYSKKGNLSKKVLLEFGDVDKVLEGAELVVEGDYFFEGTTHAAIEPHCAVAMVERGGAAGPEGLLTVWSATQVSHYLHRELAKVLELPAHRIRVLQPPLGGAFGGKSEPFDLEFCVAKLAMLTGRPVKLLYTREEVFYSHRGRHPMKMHYRTGFDKDGKMLGVDAKTFLDGGAYSSFGLVTTYYSGQLLCSPYSMDAYRFLSKRAYTNKPACGPKRGHGSVQPRFAIEVQLDKAATALGIDPIELRRRNDMGSDSKTVNEFRVGSNGFVECLRRVEEASNWGHKRASLPYGRGLGVAGSTYISGTNYPIYPNQMPQAAVQICLDRSGRARVFSGANDIGQGSNTMLAVITGEELGLPIEDIRVLSADTDLCPVDLGAYSSRITLMVGNACLNAARKLRKKVCAAVAKRWEIDARRVTLVQRQAIDREDPERRVPIAEAFWWTEEDHGLLGEVGSYNTPKDRHGDYRGGTIGASPAYSFTAHIAEVSVDEEDRRHHGPRRVGRPRLRPCPVAQDRRRSDGGLGVHGPRRGDHGAAHRRPGAQRRAHRAEPARLPDPDVPRHARHRGADRRGPGRPGSLRRQGSRGGAPASDHPGDRQRDLRRGRGSDRHAAVLAAQGARRPAGPARRRGRRRACPAQR